MKVIKTDEHRHYIRVAWELRKQLKGHNAVVTCDDLCIHVLPRDCSLKLPRFYMIGAFVVKQSLKTASRFGLSLAVVHDCCYNTPCLMIY